VCRFVGTSYVSRFFISANASRPLMKLLEGSLKLRDASRGFVRPPRCAVKLRQAVATPGGVSRRLVGLDSHPFTGDRDATRFW
jgi:hypothetical protein